MARTQAITAAEAAGIRFALLPTFVDASALEHETIHVSAGRRGLEIELDPHDLVRLTNAEVRAIARS